MDKKKILRVKVKPELYEQFAALAPHWGQKTALMEEFMVAGISAQLDKIERQERVRRILTSFPRGDAS